MPLLNPIRSGDTLKQAFINAGRGDQFSNHGYAFIAEYYNGIDENILLDISGICIHFSELTVHEAKHYGGSHFSLGNGKIMIVGG